MLKNLDIRNAAKAAHVRLWEVAEHLGIAQAQLSVKLRHELPDDQKQVILAAIEQIRATRT